MKATPDQRYVEMSIATASKETLIVKIFDVLVLAGQQAFEKLMHDRNDLEGIHKALLRAQRACTVLMGALDMEIGGDLAKNLFRVYEYWHHELVMTNMQKDPARLERLIPDFISYRQTWAQAVAQYQAERREQLAQEAAEIPMHTHSASAADSSFVAVG